MADASVDALLPQEVRVGDKLQDARIAAEIDLTEIAERTRIPLRHLEAIERSDFSTLPSATYALGFVRAYARTLALDEVQLTSELRKELGRDTAALELVPSDEIADPARIPPRGLAWVAAFLLILFVGGYSAWRSSMMVPDSPVAIAAEAKAVKIALPATPKAPVAANNDVILTARGDVWLRIYDRNDTILFEGLQKKGESYRVPSDADKPMIRTGRADQIDVTVGGKAIAPLGLPEQTIRDVELNASALLARGAPTAQSSAGAASNGMGNSSQP